MARFWGASLEYDPAPVCEGGADFREALRTVSGSVSSVMSAEKGERMGEWCERIIVSCLLGAIGFGALAFGAVEPWALGIVGAMVGLAALLWLARMWLDGAFELNWRPICWVAIVFLAYAAVRFHHAEIEYVARQELLRLAIYGLLFFTLLNNLTRASSALILVWGLTVLGVGLSVFAFYQVVTHSSSIWNVVKPAQYLTRGSGTFINPNHLAGFLEQVCPLALGFAVVGRLGYASRIVLGYAALLMLVGIGVSISRGGIIAAGGALILFFSVLLFGRKLRWATVIMLLVVALVVWAYARITTRATERFEEMEEILHTGDARLEIWRAAWAMWQDHFWWGVGPGHFDWRFPRYRPSHHLIQARVGYAHNDYLNLLCDWGLVGGVLAGTVFVVFSLGAVKAWRGLRRLTEGRSNRRAAVLGGACGVAALLMHGLTDFNLHIPANAILAAALVALVAGQVKPVTGGPTLVPGMALRLALTVAVGLTLYFLAREGWRCWEQDRRLTRALRLRIHSPERDRLLEEAYQVDPANFHIVYLMGEALRQQSWAGRDGYREQAERAIQWLERGRALQPYDPYFPGRIGMCLDWLGRSPEATVYFEQAHALDPNNHEVLVLCGWHAIQQEDYAAALRWFRRSFMLYESRAARYYWQYAKQKLAEAKKTGGLK
jgi:O-antigen ligase